MERPAALCAAIADAQQTGGLSHQEECCCAGGHCGHEAAARPAASDNDGWQLSSDVWRCRGVHTLWASMGIVAPPTFPCLWRPHAARGDWISLPAQGCPVRLVNLPFRPPRSSL